VARASSAVAAVAAVPAVLGTTNLQETTPLVWVMVAIGAAGAIVTFAFLAYAILRYRDPAMKRRRHG
jgi:heme A synthase